ncbi:MAG: hypothetical protein JO027_06880 [Solirubrobacterales bacterium]|nr:hypothetical protein [Solirubrobacterales bacterium]
MLIAYPAWVRADGDPASDVLATQSLFLPQDAGIPLSQQGQLAELLRTASSDGYAIRVAVIASRADLGSVTELWREPQTYARFLGLEVALVYRGPLLVVMPDGLGLSGLPASAATAVAGVHPSAGSGLGDAALTAIQRLARAAGHLLPVPPPAAVDTGPHGSDAIAVLAFAFGAALILIAWTASLRARPPRLPGRRAA